jgi:hypothetical protein
MNAFGMPGPGGSLGECALCGEPFLKEILLGESVQSFRMGGVEQELFGHDKCLKAFEGKTCLDLPEKSAIRKAYERQQQKAASSGDGGKAP